MPAAVVFGGNVFRQLEFSRFYEMGCAASVGGHLIDRKVFTCQPYECKRQFGAVLARRGARMVAIGHG